MATSNKRITEDEWAALRRIGAMYKDLRTESGMSQKAAAKALGSSQARVPVLEHGQADMMLTTLIRWAGLYGYDLEISLVPKQDEFDLALAEAMAEVQEEENAA